MQLERKIAERTDDLARYAAALSEHLQTVDRASDRARRSEAARRDLFARTSHELRTPLTAILGFSELLDRTLADRLGEREARYLANVRASGELLLRQINNLLDQLKLEAGRMEVHLDEIALGAMLESVASLMEGYALHRGVRIEIQSEPELPVVRVDVAKLRQVLMNLLSNAVKFSPAGGKVTLAAQGLGAAISPWRVPAYEITIRDRGPGIPKEEVDTIFEPYRQLDGHAAPVAGTGLGLPIARQFVELLGGAIEVRSELGHGSLFRVVLPADPEPLGLHAERIESGGFEPQRAQLLVVDVDRDRFGRLAQVCESLDILALRVENVEGLRRMLATLRPRAIVAPFDPVSTQAWRAVRPLFAVAGEKRLPLLLLPWIGDRLLALSFAGVLAPDADESAVRRTLRAAGVAPRSVGRRPLTLVAAARDTGMQFGGMLSAAGCDHFRVEGAEAARAALDEVAPDAVAADLQHALLLAREPGPGEVELARVPGWILLDAGDPDGSVFTRLAERLLEEGSRGEEALRRAVARLSEPGMTTETSR